VIEIGTGRGGNKITVHNVEDAETGAKGKFVENQPSVRVTGEDIAGSPKEAIQQIVETMQKSDIAANNLKSLDTFEQTMVGTMIRQFHILVTKQRGYRHSNVSALEIPGLLGRIEEKVVRAKEELGDPKEQVKKLKTMHLDLPDDCTEGEMLEYLAKERKVLFPGGNNDDTIDNLILDIANLCEILYVYYYDAWYKPLAEDV
jgi:hypothetical protein